MRYDLDLFLRLNEEYRHKPIVPAPRSLAGGSLTDTSRRRAEMLDKKIGIRGKRVLEVGCGRGHFCRVLADEYGCEVAGTDIKAYPEWGERTDLDLRQHDIATDPNGSLGGFDVILSFAVWEHMEHPYSGIAATHDLLRDDGRMFFFANLYRGPQASHRYRDVYFPWPHLLFTDEVFAQFYEHLGQQPKGAAWVNKVTWAQYLAYFDVAGFEVEDAWASMKEFDEDFYRRFYDVLSRYPRFDLVRDFIYAIVSPRTRPSEAERAAELEMECDQLREQGHQLRVERDQMRAERDDLAGRVSDNSLITRASATRRSTSRDGLARPDSSSR